MQKFEQQKVGHEETQQEKYYIVREILIFSYSMYE